MQENKVSVGAKFKLLGEVWEVFAFSAKGNRIHAENDKGESTWLDLSKADKLEWIEEEPRRPIEEAFRAGQASKLLAIKSEIIRETLELVAKTAETAAYQDISTLMNRCRFIEELRRKAREI